ncbi:MAG: SRPBCC domain-containing protein [Flavobacteriales bacterium]
MKTTQFKQEITVNANPTRVYDLLMDSRRHSELTGSKAEISKNVGEDFSVYDEYAHGKNIELIPAKKIVQTWRADEADWPEDHYSIITFELNAVPEGCKLTFYQREIPEALAEKFKQGWKDNYWKPLKKLFK